MAHRFTPAIADGRIPMLCAILAIGISPCFTTASDDRSIELEDVSQTVGIESHEGPNLEAYEEVTDLTSDELQSLQEHIDESQLGEPLEAMELPFPEQTCEVCGESPQKCHGVCRDPGHPAKPKRTLPGDIDEGDCPSKRYRMDDCKRSGDPASVYKWAAPSITDKYSAWYAGGGAVFKGRGRTAEEGTWGLDYNGVFGHARTWLNYTCGKYQGGEGAYEGEHVPLKKKLKAGH